MHAKVTAKGQLSLPKELRDSLSIYIAVCALALAWQPTSAGLYSKNGVISDSVPTGFEAVAGHIASNGSYQVAGNVSNVVRVLEIHRTSGSSTASNPTNDYLGVRGSGTRSTTDGAVSSGGEWTLVGESAVPQIRPTIWTNTAPGIDVGISAQGGLRNTSPGAVYGLGRAGSVDTVFRLDGSLVAVSAGPSTYTAVNDQGSIVGGSTLLPMNAAGTGFDSAMMLETAFPGEPSAFEEGGYIDDDIILGMSTWFNFFEFTTQEVFVAWNATTATLIHTLDMGNELANLDAAKALSLYVVSAQIQGSYLNLQYDPATGFSLLPDTLPVGFTQTDRAILTRDAPDIIRITPGTFAGQPTLYVETLIDSDAPVFDNASILSPAADQVFLSVINLTLHTTNTLERSVDLADTNSWHSVTSFVSTATQTNLYHPLTNTTPHAHYRIQSSPAP